MKINPTFRKLVANQSTFTLVITLRYHSLFRIVQQRVDKLHLNWVIKLRKLDEFLWIIAANEQNKWLLIKCTKIEEISDLNCRPRIGTKCLFCVYNNIIVICKISSFSPRLNERGFSRNIITKTVPHIFPISKKYCFQNLFKYCVYFLQKIWWVLWIFVMFYI